MFVGLRKLRYLYLNYVHMTEIANHTFEILTDLCVLDLSNNELQSLNEKTLIGLINLRVLRLNFNSLMYNAIQLSPGCFKPLESLKQLSVQGNNPQYALDSFFLPDETIKDLKMLEKLELDANADNERVLGVGFSFLHDLFSLTFSGVCSFSLHNDTFRYTINLTHFSSMDCNIMFIDRNAFFVTY